MKRQRIGGIIFDLDGVLIDSMACHRAAFQTVFAEHGIHDFDYAFYAGMRTPDVVVDVFRRAGISSDPEALAEISSRKSTMARELIAGKKPLMEGCPDVLWELSKQYRLALATSGTPAAVEAFLHLADCHAVFSSVLSGEDVTHAKPDPEIYRLSIEALGMEAADCIVVEDAVAGVEAARAAGARVIGLAGTCPEAALSQAGACSVIRRLPELPALLLTL
jgi:HAD superfamily hydrolase (TIGR01509 family)